MYVVAIRSQGLFVRAQAETVSDAMNRGTLLSKSSYAQGSTALQILSSKCVSNGNICPPYQFVVLVETAQNILYTGSVYL